MTEVRGVHEVEELLEPGERLLWEGRPIGFGRRSGKLIAFYVVFIALMIGSPIAVMISTIAGTTSRAWSVGLFTFSVTGSSTASPRAPIVMSTFAMPGPLPYLGFIVVVVLWAEIDRIAKWRAQRFGVTDRRVIALGPPSSFLRAKRRIDAVPRTAIRAIAVGGRDVVIDHDAGTIAFVGIDDPEAARSALELAP